MFPPLTTRRPRKRPFQALLRGVVETPQAPSRSFGELVREALDTALELATLGEATSRGFVTEPAAPAPAASPPRPAATAPMSEHPHRRQVGRTARRRRPGRVAPRAQVCVTPVHRPARRSHTESRPHPRPAS